MFLCFRSLSFRLPARLSLITFVHPLLGDFSIPPRRRSLSHYGGTLSLSGPSDSLSTLCQRGVIGVSTNRDPGGTYGFRSLRAQGLSFTA